MTEDLQREEMEFDVVIVGAGPAGLATAIHLKQLRPDTSVCVLEKGSEIGAHIVSGAIIEPRSLDALLPNWRTQDTPLSTQVSSETFLFLTARKSIPLRGAERFMPALRNHGNYVTSLGEFCRWLGIQAEALGVEIYPGFSAARPLIEHNRVCGVIVGDMGVTREGQPGTNFAPGMVLRARQTVLAEGTRGSVTKIVSEHFRLRDGVDPQTYGLGVKEVWEIPSERHKPGLVQHSFGWPLDNQTYGGAFLYHFGKNLVSFGFVVGLDYKNPYLSPFQEMQRVKTHPAFAPHFTNGRRLIYGARALSEGGLQSIPRLSFPGGMLAGDSAGFLNVPKIKGTHTAIKSGMLAAQEIASAFDRPADDKFETDLDSRFKKSWLADELYLARNFRPAFARWGIRKGAIYAGLDALIFKGRAPWTLRHLHADNETLQAAAKSTPINYPKPDNTLTFDLTSSVYLSGTNHEEDQPVHLKLRDPVIWKQVNRDIYQCPETHYCPAGVYETIERDGEMSLQINAQNCVHCKTCDIKDPHQNIEWCTPEGGGGPNYPAGM